MKKVLLAGLMCCGLFLTQYSFSQNMNGAANAGAQPVHATGSSAMSGEVHTETVDGNEHYWSHDGKKWNDGRYAAPEGCCDEPRAEAPCEEKLNDCYCKYVRYEPCYYYTKRCVIENKYYQKKCCRNVPKYYEVQRCKMVPQYYTETICKQEPEEYCVQECVPCKKYVCERQCKYVPRYFWKHICGDTSCRAPCPR